jgi:hypothetical protein
MRVLRTLTNAGLLLGLVGVAVISNVQQASADFDDLRWNKHPQVANAVDDFMRCARAAKPGDLGKPTQDREYQTGWPPHLFCGAVVQWDAQKARDLKSCLLNRSFGEELSQEPSHRRRGGTTYSVAYDCGTMGLSLEIEAFKDQAKVVRMQDFDYP